MGATRQLANVQQIKFAHQILEQLANAVEKLSVEMVFATNGARVG
jgi:hypothetical protein